MVVGGSLCGCKGCAWLPGQLCMVDGGHVWLPWGVCGCRGCAWLMGGMHDCRGHAWLWGGVWLWGACVGYDEIRSMSGRYASYWNAFLLTIRSQGNDEIVSCMTTRLTVWRVP